MDLSRLRENYIENLYAQEDDILREIRLDMEKVKRPINIHPINAKLIQLLIKISGTKTIIEIGTFYGYSTIQLARALPDNGKIISIEKDKSSCVKAKQYFIYAGLDNKIQVINDLAKNALVKLNGLYDMAFIDGQKNEYLDYLSWSNTHLKKGGLIILDDTLLFDVILGKDTLQHKVRSTTKQSIEETNKILSNSSKYDAIMLPYANGLTIAIKKF